MIKLIGDSHANVVRKALEDDESPKIKATMLEVGRQFFKSFHEVDEGQINFTQGKMAERFKSAMGASRMQRGERYYVSLGLHGIAFFHAQSWADLTINMDRDDRQFISKSAFRLAVLNFNKSIFRFLTDCLENEIDVVIVAAPYLHAAYFDAREGRPMTEAEYYEIDYQYRLVVSAKLVEMGIKTILHRLSVMKMGFYCQSSVGIRAMTIMGTIFTVHRLQNRSSHSKEQAQYSG